MKNSKKSALIISGGGAFGAWGGGIIQGLYQLKNKKYDLFVGTSTGSLLSPLASIDELDRLKEAYTSVTQKDIFNVNPFNKKGDINVLNAIWRILKHAITRSLNHVTLGEAKNLRRTIEKFFSEQDFERLKAMNKEVLACVVNITTETTEYKSSKDVSYRDFLDWIWASACAPIFMNIVYKDGAEYVDGGVTEHIPIQAAIDRGATDIDVIVHRPIGYKPEGEYKSKDVFELFLRITDTMHREISRDDISIAKLQAKDKDININLYYTPNRLSENSLMFEKKQMNEWWDIGYTSIENDTCVVERYLLTKKGDCKKIPTENKKTE